MARLDVPGTLLAGKYAVVSTLGEGGMGRVVAVRHKDTDGLFAVKIVEGADEERRRRLRREARAAAKLRGEHVVRVVDVGEADDGTPFLVMELVSGKTLAALLQAGPLSIERAVGIALDVCEALAEAHALGVVHRDVKPSNVLLADRPGDLPLAKVADFGIAKTTPGQLSVVAPLTVASAMLGSPSYMSPEQIRDPRHVDGRTDLWSLGVVLYEMLTATLPFSTFTTPALLSAIAEDAPTPPRAHRPEIPEALEAVVLKCLEKDPAARFADAPALADALAPWSADPRAPLRVRAMAEPRPELVPTETAADEEPTAGPTATTHDATRPDLPPPPAPSRVRWLAPAALVAVGAAALAYVLTQPRRAAPPPEAPPAVAPASTVAPVDTATPPGVPDPPASSAPAAEASASSKKAVQGPAKRVEAATPVPVPGPAVGKFGGRI